MRRVLFVVIAVVMAFVAWEVTALAVPIPSTPHSPLFEGRAAVAHPVRGVPPTWRNPFMAGNGMSEIHNNGWQTDAYSWPGPLGRSPRTASTMLLPQRDCGSITFDRRGRIVSVCIGLSGPELFMFDARTLATLATFSLPPRQDVPANPFQDFTGGGYFYLDNHDRVVTATTTKHVYVIAEKPSAGFVLQRDYDLSHVLTSSEKITSALPDSDGLLWFVARTDGVVGTLSFASGRVHVMRLGHGALGEIENSFAVDAHGGVYIASNRKLYRFRAVRGSPRIVWQVRYPNSFQHKPGQVDDGTGTTPTVMDGGYVNITDNADPMDIVVYRTSSGRPVCRVPVFKRGASATENSVIVAGRAMLVENNYGYDDPTAVSLGKLTAPGFARVDVDKDGRGCHRVWTNSSVHAPTVVPKLSLGNGLVYTYVKEAGKDDPWYWAALDFRTGKTVYKVFAGSGFAAFNNNYAGIAISRSGRAYLGVLSGLIEFFDSSMS